MQRTADRVTQSLFARSLVLDDGSETIAICVVDSCMLDRELCDKTKEFVSRETKIRENHILISATHTHSAPSLTRCLGCSPDPKYPECLMPRITESIVQAAKALHPAEAGWAVADASHYTNTRRWIFLPHKIREDPFDGISVRAMMHPGFANPDTTGNGNGGQLEPGYALFLQGPEGDVFTSTERGNRTVHFAGGRMIAELQELGEDYTVSCWLWNAMPHDARPVTGHLLSRANEGSSEGDQLGIAGQDPYGGRLFFHNGDGKSEKLVGRTGLQLKTWHHIAMVRAGSGVRVYLDGNQEFDGEVSVTRPDKSLLFVGGRSDSRFNFEGKIDEIAVFDRSLTTEELSNVLSTSGFGSAAVTNEHEERDGETE